MMNALNFYSKTIHMHWLVKGAKRENGAILSMLRISTSFHGRYVLVSGTSGPCDRLRLFFFPRSMHSPSHSRKAIHVCHILNGFQQTTSQKHVVATRYRRCCLVESVTQPKFTDEKNYLYLRRRQRVVLPSACASQLRCISRATYGEIEIVNIMCIITV